MDTHDHADACGWCRGYEEQTAWLARGDGKTLAEAQQALDARVATLNSDPYNEGGNAATRDYIAAQTAEMEPCLMCGEPSVPEGEGPLCERCEAGQEAEQGTE